MPRVNFNYVKCTRCGKCVPVCPQEIIKMNSSGSPFAFPENDCLCCEKCVAVCPVNAITVECD
ncbi:4Fe-4S dicluster domain-containing protein [Geovibrio thiophilus]|uniref:4Fe-4S dicluster domain-containing protein n=1 Tax=Geovibrio thiophilus TaxID=139438 RepID=A0A410JV95_9BACT|nr:4Fe-4S dicluster domain-containing protein [Geovibrio thiophilus]